MTNNVSDERLRAAAEKWRKENLYLFTVMKHHYGIDEGSEWDEEIIDEIALMITFAKEREDSAMREAREECAQIAEAEHAMGTNGIGIAAAIRTNSKTAIHERLALKGVAE